MFVRKIFRHFAEYIFRTKRKNIITIFCSYVIVISTETLEIHNLLSVNSVALKVLDFYQNRAINLVQVRGYFTGSG